MVVSDLYSDSVIAEASFYGGVKLNLLSKYSDHVDIYNMEIIDLGDIETLESNDILISRIGDKYGYAQIFGEILAKIFRLEKNPITKDEVCSEYVALVLQKSKLSKEFEDIDVNKVSPEDLYRKIKSLILK